MFIDDHSTFGTYHPSVVVRAIMRITRSIHDSWLSRRIIFLLRRIANLFTQKCIDTKLQDTKLRLYNQGNVCEKRALYAPQLFESYERAFLSSHAKDDCVFVDIGANVGLYSILVGDQYQHFANTRIHAIEPHPGLYKRLCYNAQLNPTICIKTHDVAIMDKDGAFQLDTHEENLGQNTISSKGTTSVQGYSLINFIRKENIEKINAMKIDVEGNEEKVLLPFLIDENRSYFPEILILENNTNLWRCDLKALLIKFGFKLHMQTRMNFIFVRNV